MFPSTLSVHAGKCVKFLILVAKSRTQFMKFSNIRTV
jgi:hypothetical protein